jgi:hypothetical protein
MIKYALLAIAIVVTLPTVSFAGNCNFASDRAADGSRCGGRAASERDGGN